MEKQTFPIVIPLSKAVPFGESEIAELRLREPVAGDFRVVTNPTDVFGSSLDLAAELSGVPATVINRLCIDDTQAVIKAVNPFLFWFR